MNKLDAVNYVLTRTGGHPVDNLDTNGPSSAGRAERAVDDAEWDIQSEGWNYNTRTDIEIEPDGNDHIVIPHGVFSIDTEGYQVRTVPDGDILYNIDDNTDEFTEAVTVTYTLRAGWCYIPPLVRRYIAAVAAEKYNDQWGGPESWKRRRGLVEESTRRKFLAKREDEDVGDVNILETADARAVKGRTRGTVDEDRA